MPLRATCLTLARENSTCFGISYPGDFTGHNIKQGGTTPYLQNLPPPPTFLFFFFFYLLDGFPPDFDPEAMLLKAGVIFPLLPPLRYQRPTPQRNLRISISRGERHTFTRNTCPFVYMELADYSISTPFYRSFLMHMAWGLF